jgi:hypothetical protein
MREWSERYRNSSPSNLAENVRQFSSGVPPSPRDTITTRHAMARPMASTSASKTVVAGTVRQQLAACVTFFGLYPLNCSPGPTGCHSGLLTALRA